MWASAVNVVVFLNKENVFPFTCRLYIQLCSLTKQVKRFPVYIQLHLRIRKTPFGLCVVATFVQENSFLFTCGCDLFTGNAFRFACSCDLCTGKLLSVYLPLQPFSLSFFLNRKTPFGLPVVATFVQENAFRMKEWKKKKPVAFRLSQS